jgi:hypothetical protein
MTSQQANGSFEVTMTPAPADAAAPSAAAPPTPGATLGRALLDKRYMGDLQATAQGQMLSAITTTAGSAGYVAIEHVTGTLHGRSGSFVLQHSGLMNRGEKQLVVTVVPDSGTDALAGLAGRLDIRISEGRHLYVLDYTLPG